MRKNGFLKKRQTRVVRSHSLPLSPLNQSLTAQVGAFSFNEKERSIVHRQRPAWNVWLEMEGYDVLSVES
jgi:hypothetical protein